MQNLARTNSSLRHVWVATVALLLFLGGPGRALGQVSRGDSAAVALDIGRSLDREGEPDLARRIYSYIVAHYAGTPAASDAAAILKDRRPANPIGTGRTGFVLFNTFYGAFLGVAIPAAFGVDKGAPYGAGLLIGTPAGFFGSRAYAKSRIQTAGQAGLTSFATLWGTWMGLGLQQRLDLGTQETCYLGDCFDESSDTAPWAAMVVGGLSGMGIGYLLASKPIPNGTSTLISHAALWGTWFGLSLGRASKLTGDQLWTSTLAAGNVGLLAAIPAAKAWAPSSSRVRLITAAGVAGGLAGFGIDLLASVKSAENVLAVASAGSAIGLVAGAMATRGRVDLDASTDAPSANSLVSLESGVRLRLPLPEPGVVRGWRSVGRDRAIPIARLTVFSWVF